MKTSRRKEQRVGIRELKANLSAVLRKVKAGEAILITERGKSVGRIMPAEAPIDETLAEGVRKRLWVWSGRKWQPAPPRVRSKGRMVSDLLLDDRE